MLKLVLPDFVYKEQIESYRKEFFRHGEHMHGGVGLRDSETIEHWLQECLDNRFEATVRPRHVPNTVFLALDSDDHIVGMIDIRHRLNYYYEHFGGHIGYGVRPSERKKGYATQMLALALHEARDLGLEKVLITCSKHNIASAKTIVKNGGVLESEVFDPFDKTLTERYWITLR